MEVKRRLVLKHSSGLYWSTHANKTESLYSAWRFDKEENVTVWLENSIYAPDYPEEYTLVPIELTIKEVEHERKHEDI